VFQEGLGTLVGYQAQIQVDPTATPKFCKARTVPYAYCSLVNEELDRLVKYGILTPVKVADWAAPIVPILKSNKKVLESVVTLRKLLTRLPKWINIQSQKFRTCSLH